jgi:dUTPase
MVLVWWMLIIITMKANEGEIFFQLVNLGPKRQLLIKKGERIGQGIFMKYLVTDQDQRSTSTSPTCWWFWFIW